MPQSRIKTCFPLVWHRWTYADSSWARIAALVPVVVSSAEDGDDVANKILHYSVEELADSVKAVVQRLGLGGKGELGPNYQYSRTVYLFTVYLKIKILFHIDSPFYCKRKKKSCRFPQGVFLVCLSSNYVNSYKHKGTSELQMERILSRLLWLEEFLRLIKNGT